MQQEQAYSKHIAHLAVFLSQLGVQAAKCENEQDRIAFISYRLVTAYLAAVI